jgi:hypothetical protein
MTEEISKRRLTWHPKQWSRTGDFAFSGPVSIYVVDNLPQGEEAEIRMSASADQNKWRIFKGVEHVEKAGDYESAEAALAVLQKEY